MYRVFCDFVSLGWLESNKFCFIVFLGDDWTGGGFGVLLFCLLVYI